MNLVINLFKRYNLDLEIPWRTHALFFRYLAQSQGFMSSEVIFDGSMERLIGSSEIKPNRNMQISAPKTNKDFPDYFYFRDQGQFTRGGKDRMASEPLRGAFHNQIPLMWAIANNQVSGAFRRI